LSFCSKKQKKKQRENKKQRKEHEKNEKKKIKKNKRQPNPLTFESYFFYQLGPIPFTHTHCTLKSLF
jgi:hypothetical protein